MSDLQPTTKPSCMRCQKTVPLDHFTPEGLCRETPDQGPFGAPEPPRRVFIATNCYGGVKSYYVSSLIATLRAFWLAGWDIPDYGNIEGVYVPEARNDLLRALRAAGKDSDTDGVLWIEHDHAFTPEGVVELLEVAALYPGAIVGAPYMMRMAEGTVIGKPSDSSGFQVGLRAQFMENVGFGFTFTPWSVYDALPQPWFETGFESFPGPEGHHGFVSDDVFFCRKAHAAGIPILGALRTGIQHAYEPGPRPVPFLKATQ